MSNLAGRRLVIEVWLAVVEDLRKGHVGTISGTSGSYDA